VAVEPTCWLAAGNGFTVAAVCKSATCKAKATKMSVSYFTKTENDWRRKYRVVSRSKILGCVKLLGKKVRFSYLLQQNVTWRLPEWSASWSR